MRALRGRLREREKTDLDFPFLEIKILVKI